jgi:hypothetical protein
VTSFPLVSFNAKPMNVDEIPKAVAISKPDFKLYFIIQSYKIFASCSDYDHGKR